MLQSQHPRFSRMASNVALLCSTWVWSSRSMEYLHIDPIYATDWSLPVLPWNRNGTTLLRMGKPLVKQTGMNEMPQADGKTALGIPWPQNACSIETNENYLSKVLQYTVKSWHRHEPHWKSEQNVAYSSPDRLQTFCPTELFGHLRWRRTDPEFLLRRRASQVLRSAQMTSKFGMESGWVEHKTIKYPKPS